MKLEFSSLLLPKSTRNIEGVLCNLSLVSRGCFYNKSGVKSGKTWSKNRVNVTITLHNSARGWSSVEFRDEYWKEKPFKCWKDENVEGRKDQEKKEADKKHYELNLERKIAKSRKIEISKNCPMLHWCTCVSFYKSDAKLICTDLPLSYVGLMTGSWKFLTAHKILPLLNLLTKFKWVLACSCSPNFCSCSQAGFLVSIAGFQCRETHKH